MENATIVYPGYFGTTAQQAASKHNGYYGRKDIIQVSHSCVDGVIDDVKSVILVGLNKLPPQGYRLAGVKQLIQLLEMQNLPEEWSSFDLYASETFVDWQCYLPGKCTIGETSFLLALDKQPGQWRLCRTFEGLLYAKDSGFIRDRFRWVCIPK